MSQELEPLGVKLQRSASYFQFGVAATVLAAKKKLTFTSRALR